MKEILEAAIEKRSTFEAEPNPMVSLHRCDTCGSIFYAAHCNVGAVQLQVACHAGKCLGLMRPEYLIGVGSLLAHEAVTYEWSAPPVESWNKMCKSFPKVAEHVANGGLILRQRRTNAPILCVGGRYVRAIGDKVHIPDAEMEKYLVEYRNLRAACELWQDQRKRKEAGRKAKKPYPT